MINLDYKRSKGTHWVSLFIDRNATAYLDPFEIEHISQEALKKIKDKSITHNIFRIQDNDSIMCGFYCMTFIEYMVEVKTLLGYFLVIFSSLLFSLNDKIKYFKEK